ncbi:MAG TPA: DUF1987 domain-containing protein [Cytophagales bacterium]|nr:DUF1987 domain-containing protein [Cytophagales bacterium]
MNNLYLEPSSASPKIQLDFNEGLLEINGKSFMADPQLFYKPVLRWIEAYVESPKAHTTLNVRLDQCDDESTKVFLSIFQKIGRLKSRTLNWYYSDPQLLELGEDISAMLGLTFVFHQIDHV